MKQVLFLSCLLFNGILLFAQNDYRCFDKNYERGKRQFQEAKFDSAYLSLRAAKYGCRPTRPNTDINEWLIKAQEGMIGLIREEKRKTEDALGLANNIIDAFYFYDDKYALAFKDNTYGFINKEGEVMIDYLYDQAQSFDYTGFASVSRNGQSLLIDTAGTEYPYYSNVDETVTNARAIDLSGSGLNAVPDAVFRQMELRLLFLRNNRIAELPGEVENVGNLNVLDLSNNDLVQLPPEINQLSEIRQLKLNRNALNKLNISGLSALEELSFSANKLNQMPNLWSLKQLTFINASRNNLTTLLRNGRFVIPSSVKNLDLSYNELSSLPAEINQLNNLEYLNLAGNPLSALPKDLSKLENLRVVDLTEIETMPLGNVLSAFSNCKKEIVLTNSGKFDGSATSKLQILLPLDAEITKDFVVLDKAPRVYIYFVNQPTLPAELFEMSNVSYDTWDRYGQQFQGMEAFPTAIKCYKKAFETQNDTIQFGYIGECYRLAEKPDSALVFYEALLAHPRILNYQQECYFKRRAAQQYFALKEYQKTVDLFLGQAEQYPDDHQHHFFLGYYAIFTKQHELAIRSSRRSLELAPEVNGAISNLVLALVQNGQYEEARPLYLEWKDKTFSGGRTGKSVFQKDIEDLRKSGIKLHPDFNKVSDLLND